MILGHDKCTGKGIKGGNFWGNLLIYVAKWTILKQRNKIKYQNILQRDY